jgi:hypothetical protein
LEQQDQWESKYNKIMGKTKVATSGENVKKGKLSYEEKRALRDAQKAQESNTEVKEVSATTSTSFLK